MSRYLSYCCLAMAASLTELCPAVRANDPPSQGKESKVVKEQIAGAFRFPGETCVRITGVASVVDAHTLSFDDGTQIELNGGMDGPELEQFGLFGDVLYPCGREAAAFLQKLIGDRPVVCYLESGRAAKPRADCFVGETRLDTEMVRGGWAISSHSGTESWEIIARQNKRGLWRGTFIEPQKWRKGERLPGEPGAGETRESRALAALSAADPLIKLDLARRGRPVVAMHFRPNYGPVSDDDLANLAAFPHLKSVELPNKSRITDAGLAHLAALRELEEINLNGTKVTAAGVVHLVEDRIGLKRLGLTGMPFRDDDLAALKKLVNLQDLSLRGSLVTDEGMTHLAPFARLKSLSLMSTSVTDAGLAHLKNLTELEDLDLDRTAITDKGLEPLTALRNLRRLQIAHTAVTDAGLAKLEPLSKLQGLNVRRTKVTLAGLQVLKRVMPQLDVPAADRASPLVGAWESIDHHVAIGSLFQPVHGARRRDSQIYFEQTIDGLVGRAIHEDHKAISHQERWKEGRTEFKSVEFADGRLTFEFDIGQWRPGSGPLAVDSGALENKGTVRVEARLAGDRLVGKWSMFTADGAEVYRGEWEAKRAKAQEPPPPQGAQGQPPPANEPKVVHDKVRGSIHHGRGMQDDWKRITGKVRVLDATTVEFADGTTVELDMTVPLPDQMAMQGMVLYPAGKEAADFLRKVIGDRPIMCIQNGRGDGPWMGYVGDVNIERAMIVNGWALADHSSLHGDEIIARENKRGLWRGTFFLPEEWSAGVRLPGEPPPGKLADAREAARLLDLSGRRDAALAALIARIVADLPTVRRLNFRNTNLTDEQVAQLARLTALEELTLGGTITDAGMPHVAELANLTYLDLSGSEVTDRGVLKLTRLKKLRVLNVPASLSKAVKDRLTQGIPGLKFDGRPEDAIQP